MLVRGIRKKEEFQTDKLEEYEYEVLGGTHVMLASKHLHQKYPDNQSYQGCVAIIYVGLSDEEALWHAMHNNTGAFRHQLTYKDEVNTCILKKGFLLNRVHTGHWKPGESWNYM